MGGLATNCTPSPAQEVVGALIPEVKFGCTVIVSWSLAIHPFSSSIVTVYVVVVVGLTFTEAPLKFPGVHV